jgi:acyl-CoA reductase-like NAD-dependent aldehyde dehydrogenase
MSTQTTEAPSNSWTQRAQSIAPATQAFIDGKYVDAASGKTFERINPATGAVLANIAECAEADVDRAVASARRAFESGVWSRMPPSDRKKKLLAWSELMLRHKEELALLETLDMGKPISDSVSIDVPGSANVIAWMGEAIDKLYGEIAPTGPAVLALIEREPIGVVGAVVPWNFPLLMASWKLGPALAAGNSVVLKPAEQSSLTALRIAALAIEAGIPEGVFNVITGFGEVVGRAIGLHADVDAVTFTGSTEVGKLFLQYSGKSNMKRISLECGGKTPNIVLPDCKDLDTAAKAAAWGIFFNQGEVCNAGSRLLVHASIKDEFLEKVAVESRNLMPGDPLDPATRNGAIVTEGQMNRIMSYIEKGQAEGAKLRLGGQRVMKETGGFFVEPTIFENVANSMTIAQEEIFGPVLSTITFDTADEAVRIANDTIYGLAAAVWTGDIDNAINVSRRLKAGAVWVNCFDEGNITVPFGGFKQSGFGRDKSLHSIEKYTDTKATWIKVGGK